MKSTRSERLHTHFKQLIVYMVLQKERAQSLEYGQLPSVMGSPNASLMLFFNQHMTPSWGTSQISDLISKVTLGVGTSDATCYFLDLVAKSCPTLCDPMDCSPPGPSVHGISQAKILEWVAISISRESSQAREQTHDSCIGRWVLYHWAIRETHLFIYSIPKPRFIVDLQKSRPKVLVSMKQQHTKKVQNT